MSSSFASLTRRCALTLLVSAAAFAPATAQTTFTVTLIGDGGDGTCDATCTLRDAILDANLNANSPLVDVIAFDIPTAATWTITPTTVLPVITEPVTVDGTTDPDGDAIIVDGITVGGSANGLDLGAGSGGSTIRAISIQRWGGAGINLESGGNTVRQSRIGVDPTGMAAGGNFFGIRVGAGAGNIIGTTGAANRNIISGNTSDGVNITGTSSGTIVRNNYIGLNATGATKLANGRDGIRIEGVAGNTIGGSSSGQGNTISGNVGDGIRITGAGATGNNVLGNTIGTDAALTPVSLIGNQASGIRITAGAGGSPGNAIGGTGNSRNIIGGNQQHGIFLDGSSTVAIVRGNRIGTTNGATHIGNFMNGIRIAASSNNIGLFPPSFGIGNTIAHNGQAGIAVVGSVFGNNLLGNSIYDNSTVGGGGTYLGIDLLAGGSTGVTPNDLGDPDSGPNNLQNYPVLASALDNGLITGTLNSLAGTNYRIEYFVNSTALDDVCDPSGFGEGEIYLGFQNVLTDGSGNADVSTSAFGALNIGYAVTATATQDGATTSEFSACVIVEGGADVQVTKTGPATVDAGAQFTYTLTITNNGPATADNVVVTDTLPGTVTYVTSSNSGSQSVGVVTWPTIASLASGANAQYTVTVQAPGSGTLVNVAAGAHSTNDPVPGNNNGSDPSARVSTTVNEMADLAVTKSGPAGVDAGQSYSYTVIVTNNGPSPASNVVATDVLPASVTYVNSSDGGSESAGEVTWNLGTLASGAADTVTVTVTAPATGVLNNVAAATSDTPDPDDTNNNGSNLAAQVSTTVTEQADVEITKSGPASVQSGEQFSYTITITNNGPSDATNVVVSDTLPGAVFYVSSSNGGVFNTSVVTWPGFALANSQSVQRTVTVTAPVSGTLDNVAAGTATTADPDATNNDGSGSSARVTTTVAVLADIAVAKSGPATVDAGVDYTYTITVTNSGPGTATGIIVTDTLPGGVTYVSSTDSGVQSGGTVSWPTIASLASGNSVQRQVTVTAPGTGTLQNVAAATSTTTDTDPTNNNGSNSGAQVTTTVTERADLQVTKTGPANVVAGAQFTYTLTVTNNGPSIATGVTITDVLPGAVTFVSASDGGGAAGGSVTWPAISLANGQVVQRTVTVTAPGTGTLDNVASASATTADPDPTNNNGTNASARVSTTVSESADLLVTKTGLTSVSAGQSFVYTVTVTNNGPSTATNVVITDALPASVAFVSASNGGTQSAGSVTWPTITLTNGSSVVRTVTVTAPTTGTLDNVASATSSTSDPNNSNNDGTNVSAQVSTTVTELADVAVTKTGPATVDAEAQYTYTITVTNNGPSTAADVVITDVLPGSVAFVSASDGGAESAGTMTWPGIALANGATVQRTVTVIAPATGTLDNVASASATTADTNPGNNDGTNAAAQVTTVVTEIADIVVTKSGPTSVNAGSDYAYTVSVTNNGPSTASGVTITDNLPGAVTFVSASDGGTESNGTVTWSPVSISNGQTVQRTVTVTAPPSGTLGNVASATTTVVDPNPSNNDGTDPSAQVTTSVNDADIQVTKAGPSTVNAGTDFSYTLTVANNGPGTATGAVISDDLPGSVTFVSASNGGTESGGRVTWPAVTLTNGQIVSRTVTVTAPPTGTLANVAYGTTSSDDPNASNNNGTAPSAQVATTVIEQADVEVTKTGPANTGAGLDFTYTVTATNHGPSTAVDVSLMDDLPGFATFVSASDGGTESGGLVTWPAVTLANGESLTRTISVTAPTATGTLDNKAMANATTADPDASNNDGTNAGAQVSTVVSPAADVVVTKAGPANVKAGETFSYTLTIVNDGPSTATGLVVADDLPGAVTFVSASDGGTESGGTVTWSPISLPNGQTVERTVTVTAPPGGSLTNTASATTTTIDPDMTNNDGSDASARVVTTVEDFSIGVSPTSTSVLRGANAVFTVTVSPTGSSYTDAVTLSCVGLPAGAACLFAPTDVTPGSAAATSTLTVSTTGPDTPIGASSFMVVGTSGAVIHDATVNLDVTKDFALSVSPTSATSDGGPALFTLTVEDSGYFDEEISFACSDLPAGVSCAFTPSTVTPNGTNTQVQLTVSPNATAAAPMLPPGGDLPWWTWVGMLLLGLPFVLARLREGSRGLVSPRRRRAIAVTVVLLGCLTFISACKGGPTEVNTVTKSFTITATAGSVQRTTTATVTVRM